jgi:hypothetical protein
MRLVALLAVYIAHGYVAVFERLLLAVNRKSVYVGRISLFSTVSDTRLRGSASA